MRYIGEFKNKENKDCVIKIWNSLSGTWLPLLLTSNPLNIITTEVELQDSIEGTGCEIGIMVRVGDVITQEQYEELFTSPPQTFQVEITLDSKVIFKGFVDSEMYQEIYISAPYDLLLSASDGIKSLKNYEPILEPFEKLSSIINKCLLKTGLDLPIWVTNTLCSEDMDLGTIANQTKCSLSLSQCNRDAFEKQDALSILSDVLKSFSCKIKQDSGEWIIERTADKYYRGYLLNEIKINPTIQEITLESPLTRTKDITPILTGDENSHIFIGRSQSKEVNSPYGKQTINGEIINTSVFAEIDSSIDILTISTDNDRYQPLKSWWRRMGSGFVCQDAITFKDKDSYFLNGYMNFKKGTGMNDDGTAITGTSINIPVLQAQQCVRYKDRISLPVFEKDYISDKLSVDIKYRIPGDASMEGMEIYFPIGVSIQDHTGGFSLSKRLVPEPYFWSGSHWFKASSPQNGATYGVIFESENAAGVGGGLGIWASSTTVLSARPYRLIKTTLSLADLRNGVYTGSINVDISNKDNPTFNKQGIGYSDVNNTTTGTNLYLIMCNPFSATIDDRDIGGMLTNNKYLNVDIGDIEISVKETTDYINTYTGKLNQNYLREAPEIDITLWNPVKAGATREDRGLVTSTSSWVNFNQKSNIYKAYGIYAESNKLDASSGLGLWYNLRDKLSTTIDLGNRLCSHILKDWMSLYSDKQYMINGSMYFNYLPSFKSTYTVNGHTDKQFTMVSRSYNVRNCECMIKLHEIKDETINVTE